MSYQSSVKKYIIVYRVLRRKLYKIFKIISYTIFPYPRDVIEFKSFIKRKFYFKNSINRILGIMDFNRQYFALGDTTIFHENLFILKEKHNIDSIDICIVEDLDIKEKPDPKKNMVLETFKLNPYIDNVLEFNSRSEYNKFRVKKLHKYVFFPNRRDQFHCDVRPLLNYYKENKSLPEMRVDETSLEWAKNIIHDHVGLKKLIVVNIRNSIGLKNSEESPNAIKGKTGAALRNSNLPGWQKFFESLDRNKYQVICVCTRDEIIPSWREKELVLFSKDLGADLICDFALIQCSYLSLFPSSGMLQFSFLNGFPALVYNQPLDYSRKKIDPIYHINNTIRNYDQFVYQNKYQKLVWEKDTYETINHHFCKLVKKLKNDGYDDVYSKRMGLSERG